uniref:cytochrome c oxidase subunit II n=1 Tax=Nisia atrovenosa TaxID=1187023 RepID=UPI002A82D0EA|nr:cytochrome c oxidase subunit II [Nisia atrovenosa]WOW98920.1 cytochrome c oxidase subunit II [Nisia atrovenosa]
MKTWENINCLESSSPSMEQLIMFHDHSMIFIIIITFSVLMIISYSIINKLSNRMIMKNELIEFTWTIAPMLILILIAIPSIKILYLMEELINPSISIKSIGHQWYWSYEYSDMNNMEFESYMKKNTLNNNFRLIETDNKIQMPMLSKVRMMFSSSDVIHSWTIPMLGIKMDAIPGRINQSSMIINKPGIFFGQCSEICGLNHSFMPISIESISISSFIKWMKSSL